MNINTPDYWEDRFKSGSWEGFGGCEQTSFFASITISNLPNWFLEDIKSTNSSILDLGCAQGQGTFLLKKLFPRSYVKGIDFSIEAINIAKDSFPSCAFESLDIKDIKDKYDVVYSSNVLEHLSNPYEILNKMMNISNRYFILLVPFQEKNLHKEHINFFDYSSFMIKQKKFYLTYYKVIDCSIIENSYWPEKQIMLIYTNENYINFDKFFLDKFHNKDFEELQVSRLESMQNNIKIEEYIKKYNEQVENYNIEKEDKLAIKNEYDLLKSQNIDLKKECSIHINNYSKLEEECNKYKKELDKIYKSNFWRFAKKYYSIRDKFFYKIKKIYKFSISVESDNFNKEQKCNNVYKNKYLSNSYRKVDILCLSVIDYRFRKQRPQHIMDRLSRNGNRVFYINANFLNEDIICKDENLYDISLLSNSVKRIYDVKSFENSNILLEKIENLVNEYAIRDCVLFVEYPSWVYVSKFLKYKYGFKILFDYIDDYDDFEETKNIYLKRQTEELSQISDSVIVTSDYLYNKAKYLSNNIYIVKNATEYDFFSNYVSKNIIKKEKKIIGYYGAIAEWFDIEKVLYVSENLKDVDIFLIGEVSSKNAKKLKNKKNILLLGEKPYSELPNYLHLFDVCIIPFKDDIDLIKATNPVKFYEYLSAGKKIVSTNIPEISMYNNKYVLISKSKEEFLDNIEKCINNKDELENVYELKKFAKSNDWNERVSKLEEIIKNIYPKVSIIILSYKNKKYLEECVDSILFNTAYPNYEIIIVDNASNDETLDYLKIIDNNNIKIIYNEDNLGFSGGNNVGIKESDGEYIVLLNNDTIVTRGWITNMLKHLENNKYIAMVGPVTNSIGNESQIEISYEDIEQMHQKAYNYTTLNMGKVYKNIPVLAMFCVMFSRKIVDEIGYLDENYIVGMFEDDDYSEAIKNKGYEIMCIEDAFVHHYGGSSFKKMNEKKFKEIFENNKRYYEKKWNKLWVPHSYRKKNNN